MEVARLQFLEAFMEIKKCNQSGQINNLSNERKDITCPNEGVNYSMTNEDNQKLFTWLNQGCTVRS